MSDDVVIRAHDLGKAYMIGHGGRGGERYLALRDVLTQTIRNVIAKPGRATQGRAESGLVEEFWALKNVSFEIKRGEVVGIVGRNGAGKSTLLKILSRITEPTQGRVEIKGRLASLLEVGTGFHPELTGRENIFLNGAILGMTHKEISRKFDEIVSFAEVEKFLDTPVKRYSSGMYVRLAFAVAAHLEPEVLVVDEVLAVGDAEFQKKCIGKMKDVSFGGRTILFVSHNISAIRSLCSKCILLEKGKVVLSGETEIVTDQYLKSATANQAYSIHLTRLPRRGGAGERARLSHFSANDGQAIYNGMPVKFLLDYEAFQDITDAAFCIGINAMDGTTIMSVDSDIPGPTIRLKKGTRGSVVMSVDTMYLAPAVYSISVGIRSGDSYMIDWIENFSSVSILPSKLTPAIIAMRSTGHGGVRFPCATVLKEASAPTLSNPHGQSSATEIIEAEC